MTTRKSRSEAYQEKDEISHVLDRPDMYVGSLKQKKCLKYVAIPSEDSYKIVQKEINISEAFAKVFVEVLSNASDNVSRSIKAKTPCTKIKVDFDTKTGRTTVWNDGRCIPIEKKKDGRYIHTMIFGHFRTGENYNDNEEREGVGRNGEGAKLCNVFSKEFTVEGVDPEVGKKFSQTWRNNMREVEEPVISESKLKHGHTCISWIPDFKRFGMDKYDEDSLSLLKKFVIDVAMTTRVNVYIDNEKIKVNNLLDYAKLYITIENEEAEEQVKKEHVHITTKTHEIVVLPNYEGIEHKSISFVNGAYTPNDGVHVDAWSEEVFRPIVDKINKKNTSKGKSTRPQINIKDVKQFYYLFTSVIVPNPSFESQSKTKLEGPEVKASFPSTKVTEIMKWGTTDLIEDIINMKELSQLKKTTTKKRGYVKVDKLDSANNEGGKRSSECILIICEGDSAKTYATTGIEIGVYGKKGRDWFGIYPLRGKILNVKKAKIKQITENKVICDLINALGLRYGVDYTDEKEFKTLRYGMLMTLTDADVDGLHILGLSLNLIQTLFPTLFKRETPFVVHMNTPIAKIPALKDRVFFDEREYNEFMLSTNNKYKAKYYKGLGTSSRVEVKETFAQKLIEFSYDDQTDMNMNKVFHNEKGLTDKRKKWLAEYDPSCYKKFDNGKGITKMVISDFLNNFMIQFSIADCERNIPNIMDGFKEGQRKVLYACLKRNLRKFIKVAQLSGYVAEHTCYHHGEQSMHDTIIGMASCYTGGNNLPLLTRGGEFGSRLQGGGDSASPRYVETHLENITRLIFSASDDDLLKYVIDDGRMVEPEYYVPVIPMVLANPCKAAIGTGWSSTIPSFNPLDLIECVRIWLKNDGKCTNDKGESLFPELVPWYRGFTGTIEKLSHQKYITKGIIERTSENSVIVKELPIGFWTEDFQSMLQDLKAEKAIKNFKTKHTVSEVLFEIDESEDGIKCNENNLKLTKPLNTSNIVLFDENHKLIKFETPEEVIDHFCKVKYDYMIKRKKHLLKIWTIELKVNETKKRFMEDIISGDLVVFKRDDNEIIKDMEKREYYKHINTTDSIQDTEKDEEKEEEKREKGYDYLFKMQMRTFTKEKIKNLESEIERLTKDIAQLKKSTEAQLWLNDLNDFEKAYKEMVISLQKELDVPVSQANKKAKSKK